MKKTAAKKSPPKKLQREKFPRKKSAPKKLPSKKLQREKTPPKKPVQKKLTHNKLPAFYIGRFQPFHLGHLDAVKQILRAENSVIIAIGSAQYSGTPKNPFTADERRRMINAALKEVKIPRSKYTIISIKNIGDYAKWPNYVDSLLPTYGPVYTNSKIVKKLYKRQGRHKIKPLKFNKKISGTLVRKLMRGNKNWEAFVPAAVAALIEKSFA